MTRRFLVFIFVLFGLAGAMGPAVALAAPNPVKGVTREFYPNGKVRLERRFKNGEVVRSRTYYENGQLMGDFRFRNGTAYFSRTYYEDGVLKSEWSAKKMEMRQFDPSGKHHATARIDPPKVEEIRPVYSHKEKGNGQ